MPRIQILELPEVHLGEATETPFAVVIDQADDDLYADLAPTDTDGHEQSRSAHLAEQLGARAVLCFHGTIEVPANDTSAYATPTMVVRVEGDADSSSADLADQIRRGIEQARATYGHSA
ncbi:hypothetical protein ACQEV9_18225 [Streptomyces chartreusis]|uniref:hypothetical protein n=1 Tax=Streptomyces chartreusis TaxID=1969 RepID=UPI003D9145ED